MIYRLSLVVVLAAATATAQGSPAVLGHSDSIAVGRAGARAALQHEPGAAPQCIVAVGDSLGTAIERAFAREAHRVVGTLDTASNSGASMSVAFLSLRGGDTVRTSIQVSGTAGRRSRTFWIHRVAYNFVRDSATRGWRLAGTTGLYYADYEVTDAAPVAPLTCLNGRADQR